jgi:hypothetical protein
MVTYHGSCLCGEIAYEVSGDPALKVPPTPSSPTELTQLGHLPLQILPKGYLPTIDPTNQLETGSAFASDIVFPANSIKFTKGKPKRFNELGSSGKYVQHHFCGNCGSSVYGVLEVLVCLGFVFADDRILWRSFALVVWMIIQTISLNMSFIPRVNFLGCLLFPGLRNIIPCLEKLRRELGR